MSLRSAAWIDDVNLYGTNKLYALGTLREYAHPTYGNQMFRYVFNNASASLTIGLGAQQQNGTTAHYVTKSAVGVSSNRVEGAAQVVIPDQNYGWLLCDGAGVFQSDGGTTADTAQKCAANGQFTDATLGGTDADVLHAMQTEDPAGAGGLFVGMIHAL